MARTIREIAPKQLQSGAVARYEIALELTAPVGVPDEGPLYGALVGPHITDGAIVFEREGGSGTSFAETSGPISAIVDSGLPLRRDHTGWLIEGDGTIDVTFHADCTGVFNGSGTITWAIHKNGTIVASESQAYSFGGLVGRSFGDTVTIEELAVTDGDIITATLLAHGQSWFFTVPAGVGDLSERLEITGGTLA